MTETLDRPLAETLRTARIAGTEVLYARRGSGPALICLHGAGGLGGTLPFFDRFADGFDVIAPRHPGFDGSESPGWLNSMDDMGYFALDLMDHFGLERAHVLGLSLGGWIGMELGIRAPERVASLTLVGAPGMSFDGISATDIFLVPEEDRPALMVHDAALAARMAQPVTDEAEVARQLGNWRALARLAWSPRWFSPRLDAWAHRLRMPVHVIWAAEDRLFPRACAAAYVDRLPNARATILPGCGHLAHIETPEALAEAARGFLTEAM